MKTKQIQNLDNFTGTILIPVFETNAKSIIPIEYHGISVPSKVFYGKKDTHYVVEKYDCTHIFIGLGKEIDYKAIKTIFRRISSKQKELFNKNLVVVLPNELKNEQVEALFSGLILGTYNLGHYKKTEAHPFLTNDFVFQYIAKENLDEIISKGIKIAQAQLETFNLVDLPPNKVTPKYLADWATETGKKYGFNVTVFGKEKATEVGLHSFLSVGQGSAREPQFIIMEYNPANAKKHIGLVGKGITFDTGGLNIKTAGMVQMKCDMAGAGAVLGAMQLIADLQLPYRVTAIVPACENSVDATSFLPSDVINSYSGHTIEIIDTDAEGRLILADGLSYLIKNYKPETVLDLATLTGSVVGTLGYECAGLFTNNEDLSKKLQNTGSQIGEKLWQLPLWDDYKGDIDSEIADVKNYSGKPVAGAISAAKFLEFFTEKHPSWAHLDIAGVAFGDSEFAKTKHATAYGVHLITKFIENL
ncbi:leucyl aminopeptidase family protein [Flavobacterium macrobrachii]|uniref:Leucyl aminopeptidase family protein n=1 Tax=Flavobacterium macrobrachii TaxID=591204 RepID=A0ABS2CVS2_9FLAO|nr:leucyl aminopeptidase family protein [Flavobacterium macrobrachii]MBM6499071.1 leucyl aminopeptidase family protein [Flavobacterium macrobrachii]